MEVPFFIDGLLSGLDIVEVSWHDVRPLEQDQGESEGKGDEGENEVALKQNSPTLGLPSLSLRGRSFLVSTSGPARG